MTGTSADASGAATPHLVPTPLGDARVTVYAPSGDVRGWLLAGHGAGGGIEARDLVALARTLPALGITVGLVEQPWRVAGKKLAPAPKRLDEGWLPVVAALKEGEMAGARFVVAGRSAGARVACRTAVASGADGVVALAFPLHPPGKPQSSRAGELLGAGLPTLVVQGERDPFGAPSEFPELPDDSTLTPVPYADHGFAVAKKAPVGQDETLALVTRAAGEWLTALFG
ncbi:hydrolase [Yinghuangia sp. ASG 101]|uniref:alpha/beta hydrolase family protein n=1 Tax=Yinghuangia sp. ASG 101 TaxID=2896848 RepID=UPI001E2D8735|nr:alpha/beta family hydrolase [Yinghuangia sp. ASG 101]UGQ14361.1 hydrolase [Yinghuangia sp. ASG 101]